MSAQRKQADIASGTQELLLKHLGVTIDPEMLRLALTHRSFAFENDLAQTNERLEFLGDSVLGLIVTDYLFETFKDDPESELAQKRASIVSSFALAHVSRNLELGRHILLGQGELRTHGGDKDSILADTFEALLGATYLCEGQDAARKIVYQHVLPLLDDPAIMGAGKDWKTSVGMIAEKSNLGTPRYEISSTGPDHDRSFTATLMLGDKAYASGTAGSKKEAERLAAWNSWETLNRETNA